MRERAQKKCKLLTDYFKDASGNNLVVYRGVTPDSSVNLYLDEHNLFGSSRLELNYANVLLYHSSSTSIDSIFSIDSTSFHVGHKTFELSNHLGNMLASISDKADWEDHSSNDTIDAYLAVIDMKADYYPFTNFKTSLPSLVSRCRK